jgi:hypothetical protein
MHISRCAGSLQPRLSSRVGMVCSSAGNLRSLNPLLVRLAGQYVNEDDRVSSPRAWPRRTAPPRASRHPEPTGGSAIVIVPCATLASPWATGVVAALVCGTRRAQPRAALACRDIASWQDAPTARMLPWPDATAIRRRDPADVTRYNPPGRTVPLAATASSVGIAPSARVTSEPRICASDRPVPERSVSEPDRPQTHASARDSPSAAKTAAERPPRSCRRAGHGHRPDHARRG